MAKVKKTKKVGKEKAKKAKKAKEKRRRKNKPLMTYLYTFILFFSNKCFVCTLLIFLVKTLSYLSLYVQRTWCCDWSVVIQRWVCDVIERITMNLNDNHRRIPVAWCVSMSHHSSARLNTVMIIDLLMFIFAIDKEMSSGQWDYTNARQIFHSFEQTIIYQIGWLQKNKTHQIFFFSSFNWLSM